MKFKVINFPLVFNSKIYPVGSIVNLPPAEHNLPNIIPVVSQQSSEVNTLASSDSSFVPLVPSVSDDDKTHLDNSELKNSTSDNPTLKKRGRPKKNNLE